jgi:hypothetical protein
MGSKVLVHGHFVEERRRGGQEEGRKRPKTRYNLPRAWLHGLTVFN